jgi:hypothetical protein
MGRIVRNTDLTKLEGDPTPQAEVDVPIPGAEEFEMQVMGVKLRGRTLPGSALSCALISVLLSVGGFACAGLLILIGLPRWTAPFGLFTPAALYFVLSYTTRRAPQTSRRSA